MKSIDSLTIEIVLIDGKLTAVCRDMGVTVKGDHLSKLLDGLGDAVDAKLFDLHESGNLEVTDFVKASKGGTDNDWDWWLQDERDNRHRDRLLDAFVAAYPATNTDGYAYTRTISHGWDDDAEWDEARHQAELGLIANGKDDADWVLYCQSVCAHEYFMFVEYQRDEWYQRQIDYGLPLLPVEQIKAMFKKDGYKAFDFKKVTA